MLAFECVYQSMLRLGCNSSLCNVDVPVLFVNCAGVDHAGILFLQDSQKV